MSRNLTNLVLRQVTWHHLLTNKQMKAKRRRRDALQEAEPVDNDTFHAEQLNRICNNIERWDTQRTSEELAAYLRGVFPSPPRTSRTPNRVAGDTPISTPTRRQQRRAEYAQVQRAWRRNPCRCLRNILKEKSSEQTPTKDMMVPYWREIMNG